MTKSISEINGYGINGYNGYKWIAGVFRFKDCIVYIYFNIAIEAERFQRKININLIASTI